MLTFVVSKRLFRMAPVMVIALFGLAACAPSTGRSAAPTLAVTPAAAPTTAATSAPSATPIPASTSLQLPTPINQRVLELLSNSKLGNVLTDAQGMTLYTYAKDAPDTSNCVGDCAKNWPPLLVPQGVTPTAEVGIPGNIGVLERPDKTYQVNYNDMPLYRYVGDKQPGDTFGNGMQNLWSVVVVPPATDAPATLSAGTIDWKVHGYPMVLKTQDVSPGNGTTISAGPYTVYVSAGTFSTPVRFTVLSGDPKGFESRAPKGETPVLAFAFDVRDARTNALITKFNKPVMLTARDSGIAGDSGYYNIDPNGNYALNDGGMQVQAGELTHPIEGTSVGWVITAPTPAAAGK